MTDTYRELIAQVEQLTSRLSAHYARHLVCRAGCSSCCHHHLSVFAVEAAALRAAVQALPESIRVRLTAQARETLQRETLGESSACPFLRDDRCAVYETRPLICRTQGLPLLLQLDDGEAEVDFCPLNFATPDATDDLQETHLVPLDELNLRLALVNLQFCRAQGIADEQSGARQRMAEIIIAAQNEDAMSGFQSPH